MKIPMLGIALFMALGVMVISCAPKTQEHTDAMEAPVSEAQKATYESKAIDTALQEAVMAQDISKVQKVLKSHADVHGKDEEGKTALMFAAQGGDTDIMQLLLRAGALVNAKDLSDNTPLFYAVSEGHVDAARLLLQRGANINAVNYAGQTPLMNAAALWFEDMVPMLLHFTPTRDGKDNDGKTAFMHACENGRLQAVELLFDESISLNSQDKEGKTALYLAVEGYILGYHHHGPSVGQQSEVVAYLLQHKANPNIKDYKGTTILEVASSIPDGDIMPVLKKHGAH